MSAYLVSDAHLNYLASYITKRDRMNGAAHLFISGKSVTIPQGDDDGAQKIVEVLIQENLRSLSARYPNDGDATAVVPKFQRVITFDAVQVLKACDCFDYQACENDDYELSEAAGIVDAIRRRAIHALPGYDAAKWGI